MEEYNSNSEPGFIYQRVELIKITEVRSVNNNGMEALKTTGGIKLCGPEENLEKCSFMKLLKTSHNGSNQTPCELLIVVTMYNESSKELYSTLEGVNKNLDQFVKAGVPAQSIGCIVIVDGLEPFLKCFPNDGDTNETSSVNAENEEYIRKSLELKFFHQFFSKDKINVKNPEYYKVNLDEEKNNKEEVKSMENYKNEENKNEFKEKIAKKNKEKGKKPEISHLFMQEIIFDKCENSLNFAFCIKKKNARKLNSHLWFFGGFCESIQPKYVLLLDVGTKPLDNSIYPLYQAMEYDSNLAGCCGEIKPISTNICSNPVISAQIVEYKFAHMFDKALESLIGYITVLPGAFSAYRWEALQGEPLWNDYFKSICHPEVMDAYLSNIYLAEDRVLCLSLISKKKCKYTLRYVRSSVAETDVPKSVVELMVQRRRWINGSSFALVDTIRNCDKIKKSDHSWFRKCFFTLQMIYYFFSIIFSWLIVGGFCLALVVAIRKSNNPFIHGYPGTVIIIAYVSLLLMIFIASLGVTPKKFVCFYNSVAVVLGIFQLFVFYLVVNQMIIETINFPTIKAIIVACSVIGSFSIVILVNIKEIPKLLLNIIQYIFLIPTYVNIFLIYSICNVNDCTWGNRPDQMNGEEKKRVQEFEEFRGKWSVAWVLCNSGFAYGISELDKYNSILAVYIFLLFAYVGALILILRVLGGLFYRFCDPCKKKKTRLQAPAEDICTDITSETSRNRNSIRKINAPQTPEKTQEKKCLLC